MYLSRAFPNESRSSTLVEAASRVGTTAYFFCNFRIKQHCDTVSILGSLLSQLIHQTTYIPEELITAFREQAAGPAYKGPTLELVKKALQAFTDVSIVLDAVDEADDPYTLVSVLSASPAKIFVSSCEHRIIAEGLSDFQRINLSDHNGEVCADIAKYVNEQLSQNLRLRTLGKSIKEHVADVLVHKSAGMFRWTQCQLKTISESRTVKQIRTALQSLPAGLDETYNQILRRVPKQDVYLVRKLLLWLAFSITPLTAGEIREAIAIDANEDSIDEEELLSSVDDVFALCGSLINVSEAQHLSLAHSTCRSFLLSDRVAADVSMFALSKDQAYRELATSCLTYLNFAEFASGPTQSAESYSERLTRCPLARHVATAWPYYVRGCGIVEPVLDFLERRQHFMSWVQILNADHRFKWNIYPSHATPLYYAATFGLPMAVEKLLQRSPDIDAPGSRYGGTALHGAAYRDHEAVVAMLLQAGADPNKADWHQVSPLHSAVEHEDEGIVRLLLDYGASTKIKDLSGETPMHRATRIKNEKVIDMLEEADAEGLPAISRMTSCSTASTASPDEDIQFWLKPVLSAPGFYDKRSGMESSIVVAVEIVSL